MKKKENESEAKKAEKEKSKNHHIPFSHQRIRCAFFYVCATVGIHYTVILIPMQIAIGIRIAFAFDE